MFEFGFMELVVVCVVALLVLGPTRLPGLVRKVGRWIGKARSMARDFREQLESEVNLDELNRAASQQPKSPPPAPPPAAANVVSDAGSSATPPLNTYPYGTPSDVSLPTSSSASSADPAVTGSGPQPGDDDYSHAHVAGGAPQPWSPELDAAPEPAPPGAPHTDTDGNRGSDKPA
jgi:sec-independent protein translocase protein TatB